MLISNIKPYDCETKQALDIVAVSSDNNFVYLYVIT